MQWSGETEQQWRDRTAKWHESFALLPIQMTDGTMVWLEYYWQRRTQAHINGGNVWERRVWNGGSKPKDPIITPAPKSYTGEYDAMGNCKHCGQDVTSHGILDRCPDAPPMHPGD